MSTRRFPIASDFVIAYLVGTALVDLPTATGISLVFATLLFLRVGVQRGLPMVPGLAPNLLIILLCLMMAGDGVTAREVTRDLFYLSNPLVFIITGGLIAWTLGTREFQKAVVASATILALLHMTLFGGIASLFSGSFVTIKDTFIASYVIPLGAGLLAMNFLGNQSKLYKNSVGRTMLGVLLVDQVLALSRINIIILCLPLLYFALVRLNPVRLIKIAIVVCIAAFSGISLVSSSEVPALVYFDEKISNSINEISSESNWDTDLITQNWRGYENQSAKLQFVDAPMTEKIFGQGAGARIQVGSIGYLVTDDYYGGISVIHNSYLFVLTKSGLVGLVCQVLFLMACVCAAFRARSENGDLKALSVGLLVTFGILCYISNHFTSTNGIAIWTLVGYLSNVSEMRRK
ncbi:O-antigen ligase family protein [Changpingibacter yushuensis]|uniref:O-antigen ligase family protein n=1 Tax=Changpingibacter yushuensis TaxID=2758440 RepID=UPI00165E86D5|nr:O-antigen ligase family protein [Changpingibacter yushuensis]